MGLSPESLARASSRHPWRTIVIWFLVVAMMGYLTSTLLAGVLTTEIAFTNTPESVRAQELLEREFTGQPTDTEFLIVRSTNGTVEDEEFESYVAELTDELNAIEGGVVADDVTNVFESKDQIKDLVLPDNKGVLVPLSILSDAEGANERFRVALETVGEKGDGYTAELLAPQAMIARPIGKAATGASKLAGGVGKVADGSGKLAGGLRLVGGGTDQLAGGLRQLQVGVQALATGAAGLADGLKGAQAGARGLSSGARQLARGTSGLSGGLSGLASLAGNLVGQVRALGNDAQQAANDADHAATGAQQGQNDAQQIANQAADVQDDLQDLAAGNPGIGADPDFQQAMNHAQAAESQANALDNHLQGVEADANAAANGADGVANRADNAASGLDQLRSGIRASAQGAKQLANGVEQIAGGNAELAAGLGDAAVGANGLSQGANGISVGTAGAATGAEGLAEGVSGLAEGASGMHEGLRGLAEGNRGLARGLDQGSEGIRDMDLSGGGSSEVRTMLVLVKSKNDTPLRDEGFQDYATETVTAIASVSEGALDDTPANYFDIKDRVEGLVSDDGTATLIPVSVSNGDAETVDALREVAAEHPHEGFDVLLAGPGTLQADTTEVAEKDLVAGEKTGILVALVVLIGVFGALIAALLPIGVALVAIPVAMGTVAILGQFFEFNLFTQNMISMIGLAVGIDYSLFIVARYREERRKGSDKMAAIERTGGTAARAVLFSGLTVVVALLGMFILPTTIFRSMASGSILVVLASILASLTLLPALLALLGDKINWPRLTKRARAGGEAGPKGGFWDRTTRGVMKHPVVSLTISVAILLFLGSFYFTINRGTTQSASSLPDQVQSKQAFQLLSDEFTGGQTDPVQIVVHGKPSDVAAPIAELRASIAEDAAFDTDTTVEPASSGRAVLVTALLNDDAMSSQSFDAIDRLRADLIPTAFEGTDTEVVVGGSSAFFSDFLDVADQYQPMVLVFVLGLSFILLMMVFRSVVVPAKAVLMNLLSVGAAYGAIVLVFQHGVGQSFFNALGFQFQQVDAIEAWLPLMLFSILFGLSMDYHVFLLSRIKERYDATGDNDEAVAFGLRTTAGIITGAALIMVAVFTAFAAGSLVTMQQMGFGLAVAVLMDATIVRSVLVPSSMKLLGKRNWYLPKWLEWLPHLDVEGHVPADQAEEREERTPGTSEPDLTPA